MKSYKAAYTQGDDDKKYWLSEVVANMDCCRRLGGSSVTYLLEYGEVAFVVDMRRTLDSGRAAITAMLKDARKRLDEELERFESEVRKTNRKILGIPKLRREKLLRRLRMCDAMWKRAADDDLIREFYRGHCKGEELPTGYERANVIRKIRKDQRAAIEMMERGYLALVPLDYIQDKSSKKMT
jgi:hypothetical protein